MIIDDWDYEDEFENIYISKRNNYFTFDEVWFILEDDGAIEDSSADD